MVLAAALCTLIGLPASGADLRLPNTAAAAKNPSSRLVCVDIAKERARRPHVYAIRATKPSGAVTEPRATPAEAARPDRPASPRIALFIGTGF